MFIQTILLYICFQLSIQNNKIILFGVDGLNPNCIQNSTSNSSFVFLQQHGSFTHLARTSIEAVSAPCWGSIFCSLSSETTGILDNDWRPSWKTGIQNQLTSFRNSSFPCLFETVKKQNVNISTSFYYSWDWFQNISNYGMGNYIDDEYFCYADTAADSATCEKNYVERAINKIGDWNLMVIYFDQVDETGHEQGWCGEKQETAIGEVNDKIAKVMEALKRNNMLEKTNIFLVADHGGRPGDYSHGKQEDSNINIPFYAYGPGVKKGFKIEEEVMGVDISPTIVSHLNLKPNSLWRGRPIKSFLTTKVSE